MSAPRIRFAPNGNPVENSAGTQSSAKIWFPRGHTKLPSTRPERTIGIVLNRYEVPRSRQKKYYHYYITPQEAGADT